MFNIFGDLIPNVDSRFQPPGHIDGAAKLLIIFVNILIGIGFSLSIVSITVGFVTFVISQGNPEKTKKAWDTVLYGALALVVSLLVVALKGILVGMVGVSTPEIVGTPDF